MLKRIAVIADPAPFKLILKTIGPYLRSFQKIRAKPGCYIQVDDIVFCRVDRPADLKGYKWDYYHEIYDMCDASDKMLQAVSELKTKEIPLCTEAEIKGWFENLAVCPKELQ